MMKVRTSVDIALPIPIWGDDKSVNNNIVNKMRLIIEMVTSGEFHEWNSHTTTLCSGKRGDTKTRGSKILKNKVGDEIHRDKSSPVI
jgi:type IV secretory pathway VirD2 relaxase